MQLQNSIISLNAKLIAHASGNQVIDPSSRPQHFPAPNFQPLPTDKHQLFRKSCPFRGKSGPGPVKIGSQPRHFGPAFAFDHQDVVTSITNNFKSATADCFYLAHFRRRLGFDSRQQKGQEIFVAAPLSGKDIDRRRRPLCITVRNGTFFPLPARVSSKTGHFQARIT